MKSLPNSGRYFLRRRDQRRRVHFAAIAECHGHARLIEVVDFSSSGLRIDKLTGFAAGDRLTIAFTPEIGIEGTIAWLVWHKAGIRFTHPLSEDDPAYIFLANQASIVEQAHVRAVSALAQREAIRAHPSD